MFVHLGEVVAEGERSKAGKKRANAPWAKLLSQYPQVGQVASLSVCMSGSFFFIIPTVVSCSCS